MPSLQPKALTPGTDEWCEFMPAFVADALKEVTDLHNLPRMCRDFQDHKIWERTGLNSWSEFCEKQLGVTASFLQSLVECVGGGTPSPSNHDVSSQLIALSERLQANERRLEEIHAETVRCLRQRALLSRAISDLVKDSSASVNNLREDADQSVEDQSVEDQSVEDQENQTSENEGEKRPRGGAKKAVVNYLEGGEKHAKDIVNTCRVSNNYLTTLVKKGVIERSRRGYYRNPPEVQAPTPLPN